MLSFSGSLKVFVAVEPCDMRRSFNGLHDAVSTLLKEDPKSGSIYAFTNKRRTLLKILYWDDLDRGMLMPKSFDHWELPICAGSFSSSSARGLDADLQRLAAAGGTDPSGVFGIEGRRLSCHQWGRRGSVRRGLGGYFRSFTEKLLPSYCLPFK